MKSIRHYSLQDKICMGFDQALRTLFNKPKSTGSPYPALNLPPSSLSPTETKLSARLMRINHAGEICAQALYHGQGFVSRSPSIQVKMNEAAIEEGDHLIWCKHRLDELNSHTSYLNPIWYTGSFLIGMAAGIAGDEWSLGFVQETETQVLKHLQGHLTHLPLQDQRSFAILTQMATDEAKHREEAFALGAKTLPPFVKVVMSFTSKVMVKTAYWI